MPVSEVVQDGQEQEDGPHRGPFVFAIGDVEFLQGGVLPVDDVDAQGDDGQDHLHDHVPLLDVVSSHQYSPEFDE
jgi:hypothetical protein